MFRLWTAAASTTGYTMTVNAAGVIGGTATCVLDSSPTLINKWEIEDTTFEPFTTNPKMVEIPMVSGIVIENVNIRNAPGVAPAGSAFALCGAYNPTIRNCRLGDETGRGNPGQLYTLFCYGGTIENVWICDHDDPTRTCLLITECSRVVATAFVESLARWVPFATVSRVAVANKPSAQRPIDTVVRSTPFLIRACFTQTCSTAQVQRSNRHRCGIATPKSIGRRCKTRCSL